MALRVGPPYHQVDVLIHKLNISGLFGSLLIRLLIHGGICQDIVFVFFIYRHIDVGTRRNRCICLKNCSEECSKVSGFGAERPFLPYSVDH